MNYRLLVASLLAATLSTTWAPSSQAKVASPMVDANRHYVATSAGIKTFDIPAGQTLRVCEYNDGIITEKFVTAPESKEMREAKSAYVEGKTLHKVSVTVDADKNGDSSSFAVFVIKDRMVTWMDMFLDSYEFEVPEGDYMVQAVLGENRVSIFQPISVNDEDIDLHVNADMATTTVTPNLILPDGSGTVLPEIPGERQEGCNMDFITGIKKVECDGIGNYATLVIINNGGKEWTRYAALSSNVDSSNGTCVWIFAAFNEAVKESYNVMMTATGETISNGNVSNSEEDYWLVTPEMVHTPCYADYGNGNTMMSATLIGFESEGYGISGAGNTYAEPYAIYLSAPAVDSGSFYGLLEVGNFDYDDPDMWVQLGTKCPLIGVQNDELCYMATPHSTIFSAPETPQISVTAIDPYLTFPMREGQLIGGTSAICVTATQYDNWSEPPFSYVVPANYFGLYGENRLADLLLYDFQIECDGNVASSDEVPSVYEWAMARSESGAAPAQVVYTFVNDNIEVDGMSGSNTCVVGIDESNDDREAPTLQRLMVVDANGNPTLRPGSPENAALLIAGGDFTQRTETVNTGDYDQDMTCITCGPAEIKVWYAPHGSDDFVELNVEEDADKFFMPGFGEYWHASLLAVKVDDAGEWFDLRVSLTDAAGNYQTQTISPAFFLGGDTGICNPIAPSFKVFEGKIITEGDEQVAVYDMTGRRIANENLNRGIYIVNVNGHSYRISVH